jgi:hypothetical protein
MTTAPDTDTIDLDLINSELRLIAEKVAALGETAEFPARTRGRSRTQELADLTRQLMFLSHLCKRLDTAVMDEYWHVRGMPT